MELNKVEKKTQMLKGHSPFVAQLKKSFLQKKKLNPRYSLRAFSLLVGVDQSLMSKVLNGKRSLSEETMERCLVALNVPSDRIDKILKRKGAPEIHYENVNDDVFHVLSNWHHFAILELITTHDFRHEVEFIANRFDISEEEADKAIGRLERLGFINKNDGKFTLARPNNSWFDRDSSNEAKQIYQRRLLEKSIESLDSIPFEMRDHSSLTIAINKQKIPELKELLREVRKLLADNLQEDGNFDEVYQLTMSFFPVTNLKV